LKQDYLQMRVLEVAPQVYACGPLFESDLTLLAKQNVRSIVNTRPDDESPGQPSAAALASAAEEYGITCLHFPVVDARSMSEETAKEFAQAVADLERPMMVCGRSGGHATRVWETAESA
jgi:sulfide:quinone oxidoreductase